MQFQYASDLHLELPENRRFVMNGGIEPAADCLILAGDIAPVRDIESAAEFWDWCSANFDRTIFVPGNHDFYGSWCNLEALLTFESFDIRPNVVCANNAVVSVGDVDLFCSTLWSALDPRCEGPIVDILLDFHEIAIGDHLLTAGEFNALHRHCLHFMKQAVADSKSHGCKHRVAVTHHMPTWKVVAPWHKDSPLTSGFAVDLDDWILEAPFDIWVYGHSHTSIEAEIGATKILSNQLGYLRASENKEYRRTKICEAGIHNRALTD